jgi:hypothetical protein
MKKILKMESKCVCGHVFGDHKNKRPHACMEPHATRAGHTCSCEAFRSPRSTGSWEGSLLDSSPAEHAERAAADMALESALRSIDTSLSGDGFNGIG